MYFFSKKKGQTFFINFFIKNKIKQKACLPLKKKKKIVLSKTFKISDQFMIHVHRV